MRQTREPRIRAVSLLFLVGRGN
jgi:hypothetical protein